MPEPVSAPGVDTIVAPITAAGAGERGAVRLSGSQAFPLGAQVLEVLRAPKPGHTGAGRLPLGDGVHADVMLLVFRAPRSLTGEDVVEMHLVGWPALVDELVHRLVAAGARPAERGEFTRRAIATGASDLPSGLAVGRLVGARDAEEAAAAAAQLGGGLAARHAELRDALLSVLSLIEAHVDFEEEDTEAVGEEELREGLLVAQRIAARLARDCAIRPPSDGETDVALLGPPNAGKSALFLALCPGASTTVSPVAGTTRDALEARVVRDGRRFRVLDGPGVRAHVDDAPADAEGDLDRRAMELYVAGLPRHAIVLDVVDATADEDPAGCALRATWIGARPRVAVHNKGDLLPEDVSPEGLTVSALTGAGLDALWYAIAAAAPAPRAPDLATRGEARAVAAALPLIDEALSAPLAGALPVVALALREALQHLDDEAQVAADLDEEVLDRIFAGFCVGK